MTPFSWQSNKTVFSTSPKTLSRNYVRAGVQRLDSASPGDTTVPLQRASSWDLFWSINWGGEKGEMKLE